MRKKRQFFAGCVCETEIYSLPDGAKKIKGAEPRIRFETEEDRAEHRKGIAKRKHARKVNANFTTRSLYSTLTFDDAHIVHTFTEARRVRELLVRCFRYAEPNAKIVIHMGRGVTTNRIHFHMISDGLSKRLILSKWKYGEITRIETFRERNIYDGVDHGEDYTGLANYLFKHWTPEQGGHYYKNTKNIFTPEPVRETLVKREYSESKPPPAPEGYILVRAKRLNKFDYLYFKYVRVADLPTPCRRC